MLPSIKTWFLIIRYKKLEAFSSIVEYKSLPSNVLYIVLIISLDSLPFNSVFILLTISINLTVFSKYFNLFLLTVYPLIKYSFNTPVAYFLNITPFLLLTQ